MTRTLGELSSLVAQVSDIYAERNGIIRGDDWFALKLQEELGELIAEHLRLSGRGRRKGQDAEDIAQARDDEAADLFASLLLYARHNKIDLESALERKWLKYLR